MRKKFLKKILIFLLLVIFVITSLFLYFRFASRKIQFILEKENFQLIRTLKKGEKNDLYTVQYDTEIYQNGEILILVYMYHDFQEIEESILKNYEEEQENTLPIELIQEEHYIQKKRCDDETCFYEFGYKNYFITCKVDKNNSQDIETLFQKISVR